MGTRMLAHTQPHHQHLAGTAAHREYLEFLEKYSIFRGKELGKRVYISFAYSCTYECKHVSDINMYSVIGMYVYMYVYTHVYMYVYKHTHTHTHTHVHTYTHTHKAGFPSICLPTIDAYTSTSCLSFSPLQSPLHKKNTRVFLAKQILHTHYTNQEKRQCFQTPTHQCIHEFLNSPMHSQNRTRGIPRIRTDVKPTLHTPGTAAIHQRIHPRGGTRCRIPLSPSIKIRSTLPFQLHSCSGPR
jgi:hypothetical protein